MNSFKTRQVFTACGSGVVPARCVQYMSKIIMEITDDKNITRPETFIYPTVCGCKEK